MKADSISSQFSLLYPAGSSSNSMKQKWGEQAVADLGIDKILITLNREPIYQERFKEILFELTTDPTTIQYRQQILGDFLRSAEMVSGFTELLPLLSRLRDQALAQGQEKDNSLQSTLGRLTELNLYVRCVRQLQKILQDSDLHSQGLLELCDWLETVVADPTYQALEENLPDLLEKLNTVPSITIGVNLNHELLPVEATLLSVNDEPFKGGSILDRLVSRRASEKHNQGIGPLHSVPYKVGYDYTRVVQSHVRVEPLMVPLFKDLHRVIKSAIAPIAKALKTYAQINESLIICLETEVAFYLGAVALIQKMRGKGLPVCCPEVLPVSARTCQVKGMYNLSLALRLAEGNPQANLREEIVLNDVSFGTDGYIFILTGPNQGGKTVYTQSVGLLQMLFQAGLYIPAQQASISPVDAIHTHFVSQEKLKPGAGRLAEEAQRLSQIFESMGPYSLVLLNESLSSTSAGESFYLARDIVLALRLYGARAIFATHLHELANIVDELNAETDGDGRVVSLVACVDETSTEAENFDNGAVRTYKIIPSPPKGLSYAKGIASRYGISYEQLAQQWQGREDNGYTGNY